MDMKVHVGINDISTLKAGLDYAHSLVRSGSFFKLMPVRQEIFNGIKKYQFNEISSELYKLNILITYREKLLLFAADFPDDGYRLLNSFKNNQDTLTRTILEDLFYSDLPKFLTAPNKQYLKLTDSHRVELSRFLIAQLKRFPKLDHVIELLPRYTVMSDDFDQSLIAKVYYLKGLKHLSMGRKQPAFEAFETASYLVENSNENIALHIYSKYYLNLIIACEFKEHKWPEILTRYNLLNNSRESEISLLLRPEN